MSTVSVVSSSSVEVESNDSQASNNEDVSKEEILKACGNIVPSNNNNIIVDDNAEGHEMPGIANNCGQDMAGEDEDRKFILPNELYKSLLTSAVLGKTVLNSRGCKDDNCSIGDYKNNFDSLEAYKDYKDIKAGLSVASSVPAFPRNYRKRKDYDEVCKFLFIFFFIKNSLIRDSQSFFSLSFLLEFHC